MYRLLAVLGAMCGSACIGAALLYVAMRYAPRGWQDGSGFHRGDRRTRK